MSRRPRVICPVCHGEVAARRSGLLEPGELLVGAHPRTYRGLAVIDPMTLRRAPCRGVGVRVGPEADPPRPRPISYEETVRLIDAVLGEAV